MKRICIYVMYDTENIADRYIAYMLKELRKCTDYILVVCNSGFLKKGEEDILRYAGKIIYRDNIGFDAGAFKDALCTYIGWEQVYQFDEALLVNDSLFGPFWSMDRIFMEMEYRNYDFWGLTKHAFRDMGSEIIQEHIQSYFMVIRKTMLHSIAFQRYWETMPYAAGFNQLVEQHEMKFTQHFSKLGYSYGCLADMAPNDSLNNSNNYMQYGYLQFELIKKRNFPFLKKKPVTFDTLDRQTQENWRLAVDYIDQDTEYDVDMIWENMVRTVAISDLQRNFHLRYIVSGKGANSSHKHDAGIVVFAEHIRSIEYVLDYIDAVKEKYKIVIYSGNREIVEKFRRNGYGCLFIEDESVRQSALDELSGHSFVCILHDCDMTGDRMFSCTGKSYFYNGWHNLLAGAGYIDRLLDRFVCEKRLGVLVPPMPNFAGYFGKMAREWEIYYDEIKKTLSGHHIHCRLSKDKPPFAVSECVWIRGEVLKEVLDRHLLQEKTLPYIWGYVAQSLGFYTGIVESDSYAALNEMNQQHYLNQIVTQARKQYGEIDSFLDLQRQVFKGRLLEFCNEHDRIYVYGTGCKAKQYEKMIPDIEAYIVSDGQPREKRADGKRILYLSEISEREGMGIVVCLDEKNQEQVIPELDERQFSYLCI